jgi:hypothetical protein
MRTEAVTQAMQVCLGERAIPVDTLTYSRQGARENTLFVYDDAWLENDDAAGFAGRGTCLQRDR